MIFEALSADCKSDWKGSPIRAIPAGWCAHSCGNHRWEAICQVSMWRFRRALKRNQSTWSDQPPLDYWPLRLKDKRGKVVWMSRGAIEATK